jgi:signal transduction histidine kinase
VAEADPDRLQQVLLILLDNALKHTPVGGRVALTVSRSGTQARVDVSDSGEGIRPADLERVFDRFYRANRARSRADGGAGLGLAIARALVTAHGGSLQLASRLGHGTTATIRLPLTAPAPTLAHRLERLATGVVRGPGSR